MARYDFTVRAKDESGAFSDREFSIQVKNNLIDRIMFIGNTDVFTSPDGVNFTRRIDKGGVFGGCWLDKWVVFTDNNKYRISSDTISWHENNSIVISDPSIGNNILCYIHTNNQKSHFIEHNNKLYVLVRTGASKPMLVVTEDLLNWTLVKPLTYSTTNNTYLGFNSPSTILWDTNDRVLQFSNMIIDGDSILIFDSVGKGFIKYNTVDNTSEYIIPTLNTQTFNGATGDVSTAWFLSKVNGVYVVAFSTSGTQKLWYSSDLRNFNVSTNIQTLTNSSNINTSKRNIIYHNGTLYFTNRGILSYTNFPLVVNTRSLQSPYNNVYDIDIFKGKFYRLHTDTGVNIRVVNDFKIADTAGNGYTSISLPNPTLGEYHTIAVLK